MEFLEIDTHLEVYTEQFIACFEYYFKTLYIFKPMFDNKFMYAGRYDSLTLRTKIYLILVKQNFL